MAKNLILLEDFKDCTQIVAISPVIAFLNVNLMCVWIFSVWLSLLKLHMFMKYYMISEIEIMLSVRLSVQINYSIN